MYKSMHTSYNSVVRNFLQDECKEDCEDIDWSFNFYFPFYYMSKILYNFTHIKQIYKNNFLNL